ncbi:MAG: LapA family protein [Azonexus sp.]|nr:LapA family protein [Azonexus sp.]
MNVMTALTWAIRLIIFAILVVFSVQNTETATLRLIPGQDWQAPLVIVLLLFFVGGAILGALSLVGVIFRQRREISRLKRGASRSVPSANAEIPPAA